MEIPTCDGDFNLSIDFLTKTVDISLFVLFSHNGVPIHLLTYKSHKTHKYKFPCAPSQNNRLSPAYGHRVECVYKKITE